MLLNYFSKVTVNHSGTGTTLTLPISYNTTYALIVGSIVPYESYYGYAVGCKLSLTQFTAGISQYNTLVSVVTIGF